MPVPIFMRLLDESGISVSEHDVWTWIPRRACNTHVDMPSAHLSHQKNSARGFSMSHSAVLLRYPSFTFVCENRQEKKKANK